MFEKNRKYSKCIFCGSPEDRTREHIFGASIAKKYPNLPNWKTPLNPVQQSISGKTEIDGGATILDLAPPVACKSCNGGFLKDTIDKNLITLDLLLNGKKFKLSREKQHNLVKYFERIGIIFDVCTSNHEITEKRKQSTEYLLNAHSRQEIPVLTEVDRKNWISGTRCTNLQVFVGFHKGVLGLNPAVNIAPFYWMKLSDNKIYHSKKIIFVINKLAVLILLGENELSVPHSFLNLSSNIRELNWPLGDIGYGDVWNLYNKDDSTLGNNAMLKLLSNKKHKQEIEKYCIKNNGLMIPENLLPLFKQYFLDLRNNS